MKKLLIMELKSCYDCPHNEVSYCDHPDADVDFDTLYGDIPDWCPLPTVTENPK